MSDQAPSQYRVLARKYRPETFADLVGQDAMVRTLKNAFAADRIAQAFIMTGIRGILRRLRTLHGDHGRPPRRRDGDGRRLAHRCG